LEETEEIKKMLEKEHTYLNDTHKQTLEMKDLIEQRHEKNIKMASRLAEHIKSADSSNSFIYLKTEELLNSFKKQSLDLNHVVKEVQQYSELTYKFNKIVEVINITAEQINLLSLNASIESARAGEYGKRFAVVASEIKELANRARGEGAKIVPFIDDLKNEFNKIKFLVEKTIAEFEVTEKLIAEVANATNEMANTTTYLNKEAASLIEEDKKIFIS
jgi:methyl-accepting chemotaxis protein